MIAPTATKLLLFTFALLDEPVQRATPSRSWSRPSPVPASELHLAGAAAQGSQDCMDIRPCPRPGYLGSYAPRLSCPRRSYPPLRQCTDVTLLRAYQHADG